MAPVLVKRTATPNSPPTGLLEGELAVEMMTVPARLWAGIPAGQVLLNPPAMVVGDVAPTAPTPGLLWWKSDLGKTLVWYVDADSSQWVEV